MELLISKKIFLKELGFLNKFRGNPTKESSVGHEGILLDVTKDYLTLTSTDGEVYYSRKLPLSLEDNTIHTVITTGKVILPSKFEEVVKKYPKDEVRMKLDGEVLHLSQEGVNGKITTIVGEFPEAPKGTPGEELTFTKEVFSQFVNKVGYAASDSDSRPVLKAIHLEQVDNGFRFVSTDSHRIAMVTYPQKLKLPTMNIPAKRIVQILDTFEDDDKITLSAFGNFIILKSENADIYLRQLSGDYPNVDRLINNINEGSTYITLNSKELIQAIELAMPFSKPKKGHSTILLDAAENNLKVYAVAEDGSIETDLACETKMGTFTGKIAFNAIYLTEAIKNTASENVTLVLEGNAKPAYIEGKAKGLMQLLLPVRI